MRTLVTGATGFIGSHVVRVLVDEGHEVLGLVRGTSDLRLLEGLPVKPILGDLTDPSSLKRAVLDIDVLFHVAADYRLWVPDPHTMHEVNVNGTQRLLTAAWKAGVKRMIYTSSAITVACSDRRLGTEEDYLKPSEARSAYQRTKILAEEAVWILIRQGAPITIVNPSTPIGSRDHRPTPTGRLIVDFLNGRLPAFLNAIFNFIDVGDVAKGHWLAADKGRVGERYILSHRNMSLGEFLETLAAISGESVPRFKIPYALAYVAGACGELTAWLTRREPFASLDGVRMASRPMQYESRKAVEELGLEHTSVDAAIQEAVQWFREHGYVRRRKKED